MDVLRFEQEADMGNVRDIGSRLELFMWTTG